MKTELRFNLNGMPVHVFIDSHRRLLDVIREELGHTGTKEGCGAGECGACTVLVDGKAINSCLCMALEVEDCKVTTIEGLVDQGTKLNAVQRAFVDSGGVQCGFCTPGMIVTTVALLGENANPDEDDIREALTGNLCRCTGYSQILESIQHASALLQEELQS